MTTLRFLSILFLLLNILVFAAARGWLGFAQQPYNTDPERVKQQVHPDRIKVLGQTQPDQSSATPKAPPAAMPEAPPPPPAQTCLAWSGLNASQNNRLLSLFRAAGIQAKERDIETQAAWKVRLPPLPTREAAEILTDSLADLGIERTSLLIEEASPRKFAISLGVFSNKANATRYLETVKSKGLHNAEIEVRSTSERHIEATTVPATAEAVLAGQVFAKRHKPCLP
ncbi:MAG: hypothetical protein LBI68_08005 [Azoarcus sp.]|jgi:cell division septation protein DedD|nr:hypothetical protein [Azoarcus sp.]